MLFQKNWIGQIYFFSFLFFTYQKLLAFFSPHSPMALYFQILMAFDPLLSITYLFNLVEVSINTLSCIPLFLYMNKIKFLSADFWQKFLMVRIIFDILGHDYEKKYLVSFFLSDKILFLGILLFPLLMHLLSYLFLFRYAFKQENV